MNESSYIALCFCVICALVYIKLRNKIAVGVDKSGRNIASDVHAANTQKDQASGRLAELQVRLVALQNEHSKIVQESVAKGHHIINSLKVELEAGVDERVQTMKQQMHKEHARKVQVAKGAIVVDACSKAS